jgi:hypothetical protein
MGIEFSKLKGEDVSSISGLSSLPKQPESDVRDIIKTTIVVISTRTCMVWRSVVVFMVAPPKMIIIQSASAEHVAQSAKGRY